MITKTTAARLRRLRILLVDGSVDASETLAELLRAEGHIVATAHDGEAGLEAFDDFLPDLALIDLRVPKLDGFTLARLTRTKDRFRSLPMIALDACESAADRERAAQLGFTCHLSKPPDLRALEAVIAAVHAALLETRGRKPSLQGR